MIEVLGGTLYFNDMNADAPTSITASDRAVRRVAEILATEADDAVLRVAVLGGGCSGFQYEFKIVTETSDDDLHIARDGARIVIDEMSQQYMPGAEIDYTDELIGASFKINNPIATANCGCGTSFSI